jgi:integrase
VPLPQRALELLRDLPTEDGNPHVFIGPSAGSGLGNMAMGTLLKRMQRNDVTVRGFRSCFMDWCHEKTAFPKVVIDMALAHVVGDRVESAYRRGDLLAKRKALSDAWCAYVSKPTSNGEVVVPLRGR